MFFFTHLFLWNQVTLSILRLYCVNFDKLDRTKSKLRVKLKFLFYFNVFESNNDEITLLLKFYSTLFNQIGPPPCRVRMQISFTCFPFQLNGGYVCTQQPNLLLINHQMHLMGLFVVWPQQPYGSTLSRPPLFCLSFWSKEHILSFPYNSTNFIFNEIKSLN